MAQRVENLPMMQKTRVRSLGREVPLIGHYKTLSRVACAMQQGLGGYFASIYANMFVLTPHIHRLPLSLGNCQLVLYVCGLASVCI